MRMDRERSIAQTVRPIRAAPVADTGFPVCPNCEGGSPLPGEESAVAAVRNVRRPPRGQKRRDTHGFPSSLNSYLSFV